MHKLITYKSFAQRAERDAYNEHPNYIWVNKDHIAYITNGELNEGSRWPSSYNHTKICFVAGHHIYVNGTANEVFESIYSV